MTMDMQSLIEKSPIGQWMKQSGKMLDDLDKYKKYEYEQTIKILKIMMKQRDMVANQSDMVGIQEFDEQNSYNLMPELLDKIIDLGLDIGVQNNVGVSELFSNEENIKCEQFTSSRDVGCCVQNPEKLNTYRGKVEYALHYFRDLTSQQTTDRGDLTIYVDLAERIRDVNTEILSIKEEFKLETERNKTLQDKGVVDINSLLSTIEKQDEKINKQTEMINVLTTSIETKEENTKSMIICNRIVVGVLIIVYITFEIYKNYNFESREDVCQVKQITHN